jgi:phenylalanyl-tRNA synthetase beta chain
VRLPLGWLRDHVPVAAPAEEIAGRLTGAGHAVDGIEEVRGEPVLDLDITANRPDCLSVRGLACEVAALYRLGLSDLSPLLALSESGRPARESLALRNDVPELCRRFTLRVVHGARVGRSPDWMAARLERAGLRPIHNIVDVTNFVMLELGQPLHAFDLGRLRGARLHVRLARDGERLVTLDGVERPLRAGMIVICDAERPASLAGVMGGLDSGITDRTSDVVLEAAWWDPVTIYRTVRTLGISSDAAYRFERGADPEATARAVDRAARLVAEIAGGQVAPGRLDDYPGRREPRRVRLRLPRLALVLGAAVEAAEAADVLRRLGFGVEPGGDGTLEATVPSHREDVRREEDLIEEVGRIVGYDRVPEALPAFASDERGRGAGRDAEREARRALEACGFLEAINYSFVARADDARFSAWPEDVVALSNPMSERADVLRSTLLPGLVLNAAHNANHGAERVRLYEIGRVFRRAAGRDLPEERLHLGLVAAGPAGPCHWSRPPAPVDPFDVKGALEAVLERLRVPPPEPRSGGPGWLEEGTAALTWLVDGTEVAWLGRLALGPAGALGLEAPAVVAEADLGRLLLLPRPPVAYREIPRYPSVSRDLSLVLPRPRSYAQVEATIRAAAGDLVTAVAPFDRYTGEGLPEDTVGLSVRLWFQRPDRTLVSEEVDEAQARIVAALARDLGARLRE